MPKVKVGDINMYYEIHGEGFPLVMIMGLGGPSAAWEKYIIDKFSEKFKVIIFDNRGTGHSDVPEEYYTIEMLADDTAGLMTALNVSRAHVLGLSMGGMIAIEFALKYPDRLGKLILCCTSGGASRFVPPKSDIMQDLTGLMSGEPEEVMKTALRILYPEEFIAQNPDRIEEFFQEMRKSNISYSPEGTKRQLGGIMGFDAHDRLYTIKKPTLIIAGKKDVLVPYENSQILAEEIPGSKLVLFDDAGHGLYSQKREEFCQIVLDFLKSS
ncbi:MAG: alpha/beta fold hydrolase [Candidatus Lokiarchaeia archaeon]